MFFLIALVYNLLHCLKIPLIVKAEGSGAEVIPFLQIVVILPVAVSLTYLYTKLISRFSREQVFYIIICGFLAYFTLFTFVLYPNKEFLQLDTIANFLQNHLLTGSGSKGLIAAIRHLNLAMFYVLAEMWSVVVLFIMFWGFANEVTKVEEAKRFYAIFALGANLSSVFAGEFGRWLQTIDFMPVIASYKNGGHEWLFLQLSSVLVLCFGIMGLFWWLNNRVFTDIKAPIVATIQQKVTTKITLRECMQYLMQSRYIMYMVLIVFGYYIVYNLSDILWAYKLELVMHSPKEINAYMSRLYSITGILAVFLALIVSGNVIRKFGWTVAALVTPVIWLLTSIGFFAGLVLEQSTIFDTLLTMLANPANLVLLIGSMQICLGRSCKYTMFDETKEIAFIPLSKEDQRKCKIIVDGLASRFGKSGGSVIYIVLFYFCGGIAHVVPYVAVIICLVLAAWIYATLKMGAMIDKATSTGGTVDLLDRDTDVAVEPIKTLNGEVLDNP